MIVGVPSGIGDVSWVYSKLVNAGRFEYLVADGWPYRTTQFLELLPGVAKAEYGPFRYDDIMTFLQASNLGYHHKWQEVLDRGMSQVLVAPNRHLELGRRLEDWLPDLCTSFHYEINIPAEDVQRGRELLRPFQPPLWGISAASYRGSESWKTWGRHEWSEFLRMFHAEVGGTIILLGGFWDDLTHALSSEGWPELVGKTSIGTAIEILDHLDGYIGFSSGLGVIRTVLDKRAFMMWPDHQTKLSTSWAPQHMLDSGRYMASPWFTPKEVLVRVKLWLDTPNG